MASTLLASQAFSKSPSGPEQRCEENMETAAAEQLEAADERATENPQTADSGSVPTQQLHLFYSHNYWQETTDEHVSNGRRGLLNMAAAKTAAC